MSTPAAAITQTMPAASKSAPAQVSTVVNNSASAAVQQMSMEDKILLASTQAESVIQVFSPATAEVVKCGVAVEPLVSGLARLIAGLFHHHTGVNPATVATK